jgi:hypothetical protein
MLQRLATFLIMMMSSMTPDVARAHSLTSSVQKLSNLNGNNPFANAAKDEWGSAVAAIPDLDGDSIDDIIVGAWRCNDDSPGSSFGSGTDSGAVYISFLQTDGTIRESVKISNALADLPFTLETNSLFGGSVGVLGDLDGSGGTAVLVGASGDTSVGVTNGGAAFVLFLTETGSIQGFVRHTLLTVGGGTPAANDKFGSGVCGLGDVNGDNVPDMVIGAGEMIDGGGKGVVFVVFMNANGTALSSQRISNSEGVLPFQLASSSLFGTAVAFAGDVDSDGVPDLAVGAQGSTSYRGAVYVLLLTSAGTVKTGQEISTSVLPGELGALDRFGCSVSSMGDRDGNGVHDLVVGVSE